MTAGFQVAVVTRVRATGTRVTFQVVTSVNNSPSHGQHHILARFLERHEVVERDAFPASERNGSVVRDGLAVDFEEHVVFHEQPETR